MVLMNNIREYQEASPQPDDDVSSSEDENNATDGQSFDTQLPTQHSVSQVSQSLTHDSIYLQVLD